jgi:glycosyltransferase involved in cell wall biosynthesis
MIGKRPPPAFAMAGAPVPDAPAPDTPGPDVSTLEALSIVHVIASIEAAAAGPSYSVSRLAQSLAAVSNSDRVTLMSLGVAGMQHDHGLVHRRFAQDRQLVPGWHRLYGSRAMKQALLDAAQATDIFHGHGLWLMPNIYPATAARAGNAALILSPRGMLAPSALVFSRRIKQAMWTLLQGRAARTARAFHATSEQEYRDIRAYGLTQPVAIIPIGIDLPPPSVLQIDKEQEILFLGRLHPIKGLDDLIAAWRRLAPAHPQWRLRIAGPGDASYVAEIKSLARDIPGITVDGPLYGPAKTQALARASLFVLPSHGENFAVAVAEALAHGTPVISTKGTPWSGLVDNGCGWWVERGADGITAGLMAALAHSATDLAVMGRAGRQWMERDFGWERIARETRSVYVWLKQGGPPPACVRLD